MIASRLSDPLVAGPTVATIFTLRFDALVGMFDVMPAPSWSHVRSSALILPRAEGAGVESAALCSRLCVVKSAAC